MSKDWESRCVATRHLLDFDIFSLLLLLLLPTPIFAHEVEGCIDSVDGVKVDGEPYEVEG